MESFLIPYRNNRIHGVSAGQGTDLIVCLHGFGESCRSFDCLIPVLGNQYKIVSLDLPGHGETSWEDLYFRPKELKEILEIVLEMFHFGACTLVGYSMGGRLALCALQIMPQKIHQLILLAPDGLKLNFWQGLATRVSWGNRLFRFIIHRPSLFYTVMKTGHVLGLVNGGVFKFVSQRMDSAEKRLNVYRIWTGMKDMYPGIQDVRRKLDQFQIPLLLIFGKYDRVIPPSQGRKYFGGQKRCEQLDLEKGHLLLTRETAELIREWLEKP